MLSTLIKKFERPACLCFLALRMQIPDHKTPTFYMSSQDQTQVLQLAWQALYHLSCCLQPHTNFIKQERKKKFIGKWTQIKIMFNYVGQTQKKRNMACFLSAEDSRFKFICGGVMKIERRPWEGKKDLRRGLDREQWGTCDIKVGGTRGIHWGQHKRMEGTRSENWLRTE